MAFSFSALTSCHDRNISSNEGDIYVDMIESIDDESRLGYIEEIGMAMPIQSEQYYVLVVDGGCSVCISQGLEYISKYLDKERIYPLLVAVKSDSMEMFLYYFESIIGTDHNNIKIAGLSNSEAKLGLYYIKFDEIKSYEAFSR